MFSWIPIHIEAAQKLLKLDGTQLIGALRAMESQGLTVISLEDRNASGESMPLTEVDPFTFFASFNRGITDRKRQDNWAFLKQHWDLSADVPADFTGIPTVFNRASWF